MLITELWTGQGLGNQLACYTTTRCIAIDSGYEFGVAHPERFKGSFFLKHLDFGKPCFGGCTPEEGKHPTELQKGITNYYVEKTQILPNGSNVTTYDKDLVNVPDNTKIDGLMQGEEYFIKHKEEIRGWLRTDLLELPENLCIINFRGGEYSGVRDFFLPKSYWDTAINNMRKVRPDLVFHVVTDDPLLARNFFTGDIGITHNISDDYRSIQSAHYLILSNSSFAFFPTWLNTRVKFCIAPKYWGRYNTSNGYWSLDQNYTKGWHYQDREGNLSTNK